MILWANFEDPAYKVGPRVWPHIRDQANMSETFNHVVAGLTWIESYFKREATTISVASEN